MINRWSFQTALWRLTHLDMQELVDAGAIEDRDYATWDEFQYDPVGWFLGHPGRADAVWKAIGRHKPSSQTVEPPEAMDNIVSLKGLCEQKR
jgi:hypothetical protein